MGFANHGGGHGGLSDPLVAIKVVHDPGGGARQQATRSGCCLCSQRIGRRFNRAGQEGIDLALAEIRRESGQRVALHHCRCRLTHHRRTHHHAEGVEGDLALVAVGITHQARLQHPVVVAIHRDAVSQGVAGFRHQQVVAVELHEGRHSEGITDASGQEEVLPRFGQLAGRWISRIC